MVAFCCCCSRAQKETICATALRDLYELSHESRFFTELLSNTTTEKDGEYFRDAIAKRHEVTQITRLPIGPRTGFPGSWPGATRALAIGQSEKPKRLQIE